MKKQTNDRIKDLITSHDRYTWFVLVNAVYFTADRPFVFLIRDNASGAVLFMGRLLDPRNDP